MHSNPSPRPSTSSDDLCRADDHDSPIEIDHGDVVKTNRTEGTFAPEEQLFHESERVQDGEPVREGRFAFERIDPPGGTTPQPGSLILSGQVTLPSKTTASEETTPHQNTTSHQATTSATASDGMTATVKSVASKPAESRRVASRRVESRPSKAPAKAGPDPVVQSLMLLMTMAIMLAAARFAVPSIVEEIRYAWLRGELRAEYETGTEGLRNVSLDALSDAYEMVTAAVGPSVVHIEVQRRPEIAVDQLHKMISESPHSGWSDSDQGSGVIVDAEGYVVTNRHVVADGEDITVTLSDGRRVPAVVLGNDALTDLAVLKINASGLIPITWGDSDRCRVGSPVWAVGSPFGLDRTVTFGILSGKHRRVRASTQYQDFMQSDVAVNPGNSGGPLVDARGTLVGIEKLTP